MKFFYRIQFRILDGKIKDTLTDIELERNSVGKTRYSGLLSDIKRGIKYLGKLNILTEDKEEKVLIQEKFLELEHLSHCCEFLICEESIKEIEWKKFKKEDYSRLIQELDQAIESGEELIGFFQINEEQVAMERKLSDIKELYKVVAYNILAIDSRGVFKKEQFIAG